MEEPFIPRYTTDSTYSQAEHGGRCPMVFILAVALSTLIVSALGNLQVPQKLGLSINLEEFNARNYCIALLALLYAHVLFSRCIVHTRRNRKHKNYFLLLLDNVLMLVSMAAMITFWAYLNIAVFTQCIPDSWLLQWFPSLRSSSYSRAPQYDIWVVLLAACIVIGFLVWRINDLQLVPKIMKDFHDPKNAFAGREIRPTRKSARFLCWIYWSLGLVAGVCFLSSSLPQVLQDFQRGSFTIWSLTKTAFGFLVVFRKCRKMDFQTLHGNQAAMESWGLSDMKWILYTKPCSMGQMIMVYVLMKDLVPENGTGYVRVLPFGNADAIFIMSTTLLCWIFLSLFVTKHWLKAGDVFWTVRFWNSRGNQPVDENFGEIYLTALGIYPSSLFDKFGLDERMGRRLDHHCCLEWAASKGLRYFTFPQLMREEKDLLDAPAVNNIASYTKVMLYSVKTMTVEAGRLDPLFMRDVKLPFEKQKIQTFTAPVAGLELATWDEQYSSQTVKRTESSSSFERSLQLLHWMFPKVEHPRWFINELEGVLTYEAVVASFAATSNTVWKDLTTDSGLELLVFNGIGQFLLRGRYSTAFRELFSPNSKGLRVPEEIQNTTEYVIDYSWIGDYDVRKKCARYGFIACFDKKRRLTHIYVSHWQNKKVFGDEKKDSVINNGWIGRPSEQEAATTKRRKCWEHAKFVIKATLGAGVTINDHLLCAHWIVANTASLAVRTHLQYDHPIRRLMHTFVLRTASINFASSLTLLPEDRFVHRASGFKYKEMARCINDAAKFFAFKTFPEVVKESGLGYLAAELPWAEDGLQLWKVIHDFVTIFIGMFFVSDEEIMNDQEIQAMWKMISDAPKGPEEQRKGPDKNVLDCAPGFGYKLPKLSEGKGARANLANYLSHVIFWVTANHEYFGALAEYFTTPAGLGTKIWDEEHEEIKQTVDECGQVMSDIETYMQDLCVVSATGYPQPRFLSDWSFLLCRHEKTKDRGRKEVQQSTRQNEFAQWSEEVEEYVQVLEKVPNYECIPPELAMSYNTCQQHRREVNNCTPATPVKQLSAVRTAMSEVRFSHIGSQKLMQSDEAKDERELLIQVHDAFMENLRRLDWDIEKRNESRPHPFEAFKPTNLECSVNI